MSVLSEDLKNRIRAYLPKYPRKQAVTLPALHLVHDELRTVSNEAIVEIAEILELHPCRSSRHDDLLRVLQGRGREARARRGCGSAAGWRACSAGPTN